jgi:hypothetical protein
LYAREDPRYIKGLAAFLISFPRAVLRTKTALR